MVKIASMLLKNCKLVGKEKLQNILITDGKIKEVTDEILTAEKSIDIGGKYALPGIIDPHVHFRDFEQSHKEDFLTGSMAAAAGGITTVLDMPNTQPVTDSMEILKKRRESAKKSIVNYGFHFAATAENADMLDRVKGAASVKLFMNMSTGKLMINDPEVLQKIYSKAKLLSVHAEGKQIEEAVGFHANTKNKVYFCHVSAKTELDFLRKNKKGLYIEVTPHHLFLTDEDAKRLGSYGEMKPCLKTKEDVEALWQGIEKGVVDTIGTDHAPHTKEEKDAQDAPSGVTGCETMLALLLDAVNKGRLKIEQIVQLCCENPAKIFRLKNKGKIEEGYDADLTVVDMNLEREVKNEELMTKVKWSPFNGWKLKGWPVMTIVNGRIAFENEKANENAKGKEVKYEIPMQERMAVMKAAKLANEEENGEEKPKEDNRTSREIMMDIRKDIAKMEGKSEEEIEQMERDIRKAMEEKEKAEDEGAGLEETEVELIRIGEKIEKDEKELKEEKKEIEQEEKELKEDIEGEKEAKSEVKAEKTEASTKEKKEEPNQEQSKEQRGEE